MNDFIILYWAVSVKNEALFSNFEQGKIKKFFLKFTMGVYTQVR